jgi:hypothetical protein
MFSIKLLPGKAPRTANAEIVIGAHKEIAEVPLQYWRRDQYRDQWHGAIERIVSGKPTACLITGMHDPRTANFLMWWPMWREGEIVYIQNQILFMDDIRASFNESEPHRFIPKRATVTDDGEKISEWSVNVNDIR